MLSADQFNVLSRLLGDYGMKRLNDTGFWTRMRQHGLDQDDIDLFLVQHWKTLAQAQPRSKP